MQTLSYVSPSSEIIVILSPNCEMKASPSHVLCFFPCGFRLNTVSEHRTVGWTRMYQFTAQCESLVFTPEAVFFMETVSAVEMGFGGRKSMALFSGTRMDDCTVCERLGMRGTNCFAGVFERMGGEGLCTERAARPKHAPERKSCLCTIRSISMSLPPTAKVLPSNRGSAASLGDDTPILNKK